MIQIDPLHSKKKIKNVISGWRSIERKFFLYLLISDFTLEFSTSNEDVGIWHQQTEIKPLAVIYTHTSSADWILPL